MSSSATSHFVDPQGHPVPSTSRYIVKMFCKSCNKIYDKRECFKHIYENDMLIVKQRGHVVATKKLKYQ